MTTLSLSQVSKQFKVNRSTIYRAVSSGRLSRRADGTFDLAEVIRCFGEPVALQQPTQQLKPVEPNQDQAKMIEQLQKELQRYIEREDRLLNQIDRMQTLIEMKSSPVADATSQQQMHAAQSNDTSATHQNIADTDIATGETLHAAQQQYPSASLRNTADAIVQPVQKKRGLFGRLVKAVLDD